MAAAAYNFEIEQGATFSRTFTWKDDAGVAINITGYTARLQIRTAFESSSTILSLTSSSGITLGGSAGTIVVSVSATDTAALDPGSYVYDLELVNGATVTRLLAGYVEITPEVTR